MKKIILLHGSPFSGKGTQQQAIAAFFRDNYLLGVITFDMGDRLREIKEDQNHPLHQAVQIIDGGNPMPLELICSVWRQFLETVPEDIEYIILSGVVRLVPEVQIFIDYITSQGTYSSISIFRINITPEEALKRVEERARVENRTDDLNELAVENRFAVYYGETTKAINTFKQFAQVGLNCKTKINFFEIDGERGIHEIRNEILSRIFSKKLQFTIHGQNGSSKSTIAKLACQALHFSPESSGDYARKISAENGVTVETATASATENAATAAVANFDDQIDDYVRSFNLKNGFIMDTRMGFHFLPDSFKIYFKLAPEIAAQWIWNNPERRERELQKEDINSVKDLANSLRIRAENDQKRYLGKYGVDIWDERNYDLVVEVKEFENKKHDLMVYVLEQFFKWLTSK